jgi:hypothetical protein
LCLLLSACRQTNSPLPLPDSIESLCLGVPPQTTRIFKLPSISGVRSDQLVTEKELHVDVAALGRVAASPAHEGYEPQTDEDGVRLYVTEDGGGVLVWWRTKPVLLHYAPVDTPQKHAKADVFGAAVADGPPTAAGRLVYLLERPTGSAQAPEWRAFVVQDAEHVCT